MLDRCERVLEETVVVGAFHLLQSTFQGSAFHGVLRTDCAAVVRGHGHKRPSPFLKAPQSTEMTSPLSSGIVFGIP